ncbi:antitoxin [Sorangium sp. So ce124]|uniref:antitoxin n=1 Tax=Sorangium sp. So ce124 TaxID=3133280 RepID=UPI003F608CD9
MYILCAMSTASRAKIFKNGGSQAVRLPKDCRFPDGEVLVRREGRRVILEPIDEWPSSFRACLGAWPDEIERPAQEPVTGIEDPFE